MRSGSLSTACALLIVTSACASPYRDARPGTEGKSRGTIVGRVSPGGEFYADTLARVVPDTARVERETVVSGAIRQRPDAGPMLATGFRVQVLAIRDQEAAESFAGRLQSMVGGDAVYVEWVEPYYKVRVGDFSTRDEAEPLRLRLIDQGIEEAWTVRTTIRTDR